ncbi:MAG: hypothetical protein CMN30_31660 [Sandaracinus sp.]|nr:hypothetical protein [Sandaracinus sp.]
MAFRDDLDALKAQNESLRAQIEGNEERMARAERVLERAEAREDELSAARERILELESGPNGEAARDRRADAARSRRWWTVAVLALGAVALLQWVTHGQTERALEQQLAQTQAELASQRTELADAQEALRAERRAHRDTRRELALAGARPEVPDMDGLAQRAQEQLGDPALLDALRRVPGAERYLAGLEEAQAQAAAAQAAAGQAAAAQAAAAHTDGDRSPAGPTVAGEAPEAEAADSD